MEEKICKLLASFKIGSYKIHSFHTDMKGDQFLNYHSFLGEIYTFLEDNIDRLKERARQLEFYTPQSLKELIEESEISETESEEDNPITDIKEISKTVASDLDILNEQLQDIIEESGSEKDFVTQNKVIDFQETIGKFIRFNKSFRNKE